VGVHKNQSKPRHKQPSIGVSFPDISKSPRVASDPNFYQNYPAWRISVMEMCDPFGWHRVDEKTLNKIREKLANFESMTWREILIVGKNQHHLIKRSSLCKKAQKRLVTLRQDDIDELVSLRLAGIERIYGILENSILRLLWWDPNHAVCPSIKRHT